MAAALTAAGLVIILALTGTLGGMLVIPEVRILKVDGVAPNNTTIGNGTYPLTNPFYAIVRHDEPADSPARLIAQWLMTMDGQQMMEMAGYTPADETLG